MTRVVWTKDGPLSVLVMNREETEEKLFSVNAATGASRALWTDATMRGSICRAPDSKDIPYWLQNGDFLWQTERNGKAQLEVRQRSTASFSMP